MNSHVQKLARKPKSKRAKRKMGARISVGPIRSFKLVTVPLGRRSLGSDVVADTILTAYQYHKRSDTAFNLYLQDIPTRDDAAKKSYDVNWFVPGFTLQSTSDGNNACHLMPSSITFENLCDYDLFMRVQRPMGYKSDPSALAMWEPFFVRNDLIIRLAPRTKHVVRSDNASTTFMCPRHKVKDSRDVIHLISFNVFREYTNIHGNNYTEEKIHPGVGLNVSVETNFRVNDGTMGKQKKAYYVERFDVSNHLDIVVNGPVQPVRFRDVVPDGKAYDGFGLIERKSEADTVYLCGVKSGVVPTSADMSFNLDADTMYRLPYPAVLSYKSKDILATHVVSAKSGVDTVWVAANVSVDVSTGALVTLRALKTSENFLPGGRSTGRTFYTSDSYLTPDTYAVQAPSVRSSHRAVNCLHLDSCHRNAVETQLGIPFLLLLDAAVMVIEALRTAHAYAAAIGILESVSIGERPVARDSEDGTAYEIVDPQG